ncbi:MAG: CBS domain-containing protein, partial [Candidatus Omnitrophota bacterium]|nr:CBS domain-containing protein [Candidatus Omnitrophota bacterium]
MKVREIMKEKVVSIKPQDNALEALRQLFKMKISGLPVIDEQGKLAGMFTEKEVLSYVLPSYIEKVGRFVYEEHPKAAKKKFSELTVMTVSQIMRREVVTVNEETTLSEAARIMLTQKARRLPVIDKSGRVVGIIARCDVVES